MKKLFCISAVILSAIIAASCTKETVDTESSEFENCTISMQYELNENESAKTYLASGLVKWVGGDTDITVFDSENNNRTFVKDGDDVGSARNFSGSIATGSTVSYVLFPKNTSATVVSGTIHTTVPASQGVSNTNSFAQKVNVAVSKDAANLKNACGYLKFTLPSNGAYGHGGGSEKAYLTNIKSLVIEGKNGQSFAGNVAIDFSSENPVATLEGEPTPLTLTAKSTNADGIYRVSKTDIYACVIPGTYHGLKITVNYIDETSEILQSDNDLTVSRSQWTTIPLEGILQHDPGATTYRTVTANFEATDVEHNSETGINGLKGNSFAADRVLVADDAESGLSAGYEFPADHSVNFTNNGYQYSATGQYGVGYSSSSSKVISLLFNNYRSGEISLKERINGVNKNRNWYVGNSAGGTASITFPAIEGYALRGVKVSFASEIQPYTASLSGGSTTTFDREYTKTGAQNDQLFAVMNPKPNTAHTLSFNKVRTFKITVMEAYYSPVAATE